MSATQVITLFEYEWIDDLNPREIALIHRLSRNVGVEILRPGVRQGQPSYQARQYVGVIRLGRRTLQILPKVHRAQDVEQSIGEATRNLLWMLDYAGYLGIREVSLAALRKAENWFEVLIYLFATHLKRQWVKGAARTYQPIDAVLPVLKGKWQTAVQVRRPEQKHRFAVTYDEFTVDNPLNRIFRYVVERLWYLTRDSQNRQLLTDLRYWMDEVALLPALSIEEVQNTTLNRLNQQYEPLLNLARLFLERLGLELAASDTNAFAFIFDMNQLFEGFMTGFIQRHRAEILPASLENCELLPQSRQAVRYMARYQGNRVFRLKPDLVLREGGQYPLLVDFKYKVLAQGDRKLGIQEADFYQMYAYLNRFKASRLVLMYPQTVNMPEPIYACFDVEEMDAQIVATTVNLLRDLSDLSAKQALKVELQGILEGNL